MEARILSLKLSLEQMALGRLLVNVWNGFDILALIADWKFDSLSEYSLTVWRETVEDKVKVKVSKLVIPKSLMAKALQLVRPIGLDILKWKMFHEREIGIRNYNTHVLEQLRWTSAATIDYGKTAERLVVLRIFPIAEVYHLACLYCLVDYIPDIWMQMPYSTKSIFYIRNCQLDMQYIDLNYSWAYLVNEGEAHLPFKFYETLFFLTVHRCNKMATRYFALKLSDEERGSCAFQAVREFLQFRQMGIQIENGQFPTETVPEMLIYLFSLISPGRRRRLLRAYPCTILRCFLNWPWQDVFLDIADIIWTILPESSYGELVSLLIVHVKSLDYYSPSFLQELFLRSPVNFRKQLVLQHSFLFPDFFRANDTETIKVVFRNITSEDRVRLVSDLKFFQLLDSFIMTDKCHLVELCLREATLSKEEMQRLKSDFMRFITEVDTREVRRRKRKWTMLLQFCNETDASVLNKRSFEGEMLTTAKKTCYE